MRRGVTIAKPTAARWYSTLSTWQRRRLWVWAVPASFRRPAEPRNGAEHRRSVPLRRAPFWTFARLVRCRGQGGSFADGRDDRIPGTRRAANRVPAPAPKPSSLHPLDAALNLLPERSLVDMRRGVTIATASRAPPRTPWKPQWYSTLSTWQRRCGVRCSSPSSLKACRHLARDRMVVDRRTVTLGCSCDGPQAAPGRRRIDAY